MLLFVVTVQTYTLFDKVRDTYHDHVLTFDLNLPTWPFFARRLGSATSAAVMLIAIRTWRLIFQPELIEDEPPHKDSRVRVDRMSNDTVAVVGFIALFVLMLLRVPVGMAMGLVGVTGYSYIVGAGPALKLVGLTSMRTVTDYTFGVIPMFMLMGAFVSVSGVSRGAVPRGQRASSAICAAASASRPSLACGGFAAICGSSVATAATFSGVAYPEMRRFGYPQLVLHRRHRRRRHARRDAAALDRAGRSTRSSPSRTSASSSWPASCRALLAMAMYVADHQHHRASSGPTCCPPAKPSPGTSAPGRCDWSGRRWCCSSSSSAASTAASSRRPRPAASARAAPSSWACCAASSTRENTRAALLQATRTTAAVFTVLIGALLFGYFLTDHADAAEAHRIPHRRSASAATACWR